MSADVVRRALIAMSYLEIAAQGLDQDPSTVKSAIERVVGAFRECAGSFSAEQRARAVAALEAIYSWRQARIAAFLESMNDAFAVDLEEAKDLISRR